MRNNQPVTQRNIDYPEDRIFITKTDLKGIITYANDSFVEVSGFTHEELVGHNHNLVRHPDMPAWAFEDLWNTIQAGEPWTGIVKNRAKCGDHYWVKASVSPIKDDGNIIGYISLRKKPTAAEIAAAEALYQSQNAPEAKRDLKTRFRNLPLQAKLQLLLQPLMFVFLLLTAVTASVDLKQQMLDNAQQHARSVANEVLDSANMLMVTGQIGDADTRALMLQKIAESNGIASLRLIRSDLVSTQFGKGLPAETTLDADQQKVMKNRSPAVSLETHEGKPLLRLITPYLGSRNHNGTDCLACHTVQEGGVLGVSDISIDMSAAFSEYHWMLAKLILGQLFAQTFMFFFIRWVIGKFVSEPVSDINGHLQKLVNGNSDMSHHADISRHDEMGEILCSVQSTKVMTGSIIDHITAAAKHVDERSARLSSAVESLSKSATTQSDAAGSMAAAVEQMSVSVDQIASNAKDVKNFSVKSKQVSDEGAMVARQAVRGIEEANTSVHAVADTIRALEKRSDAIRSIVNMIKEVASQTNLLALNAAIEAARAGEQGRGFAVVADEVRKLSDTTGRATSDIEGMISSMRETATHAVSEMEDVITKMELGAELTNKAGSSIVEINDGATQVLAGIEDILSSLQEQTLASHEIATNVEKVAQMAEANRIAVESVDRTSEKLADFALELKTSVQHFRI